MFPIGDIEKSEVRRIAEEQDLATAKKKILQESVSLVKETSRNFYRNIYQHNQVTW